MTPATEKALFTTDQLRTHARWIRDDLEQNILRSRTRTFDADTIVKLHALLVRLSQQCPTLESIRESRIHRAILAIVDSETLASWPGKITEVGDRIVVKWEFRYGTLKDIRNDLFAPGGRLHGIAEPYEANRKALVEKWTSSGTDDAFLIRAYEHGHLDFKPGQWWIHPIFAFHAGIISIPGSSGGISYDSEGAYALVLTEEDLMDIHAPIDTFVYRTRPTDPGRFRLINSFLPVKTPLRVLRTHTFLSKWSPDAGIRYDGLYKITDWSARGDSTTKGGKSGKWIFDLTFRREPSQTSVAEVLLHPLAEEMDDYKEYRRTREQTEREIEERDPLTTMDVLPLSQEPLPGRRLGINSLGISPVDLAAAIADSLVIVTPPVARRLSRSEPAFSLAKADSGSIDVVLEAERAASIAPEVQDNPLVNIIRPSVSSEPSPRKPGFDHLAVAGMKAFAFPVESSASQSRLKEARKGLGKPEVD